MAQSSVDLIVNAVKAVNPLRAVAVASKKAEKAIDDLKKKAKATGDQLANMARKGKKGLSDLAAKARTAAGSFGKLGKAALLAAAAAGAAAFLKFSFGQAGELERQTKSLQVLTGSLKAAKGIISELQAFGAITPFTSTELIETAKRMKAFGFETNQVVGITKRLADVAGATGADLGGIATAFGQIQAKGRLQGEELLQLQERGVALQDELRKMYGMTGQEFSKALQKGQISAKAAEVALIRLTEKGGKYANGAIAQSDTLFGKLSTLQDALQRFGQNIGKVLSPIFKGIIDFLTTITNQINNIFRESALESQARKNLGVGEKGSARKFFKEGGRALLDAEKERLRKQGFGQAPVVPDTKIPELLKSTSSAGTDNAGQAEAQLKRQMEAAQSLSTEFQRQIELTNELDDAKDRILQRDFEIADLNAKFPDLKDEEIEKLEELIHKLHDAKEGEIARTEAANNAAKAAEAARKAQEAEPLFQMQQQFEELIKLENQVAAGATSIGTAFSNAFGAVVTGAKTGQEALADMLKSIASDFIAMAQKIIAQQLAMILYQTILKALGGPSMGGDNYFDPKTGLGVAGPNFGLAEGGVVNKPTNALIGEGGEPEYVIPASKMRESMSRYSRGSRGGGVIPDNRGGSASEDGGTAVAAPIDVRYTVERINSVDYVTADQFQSGMQSAAAQGAQRGEQNTLKRLQMSGGTRKRLGL